MVVGASLATVATVATIAASAVAVGSTAYKLASPAGRSGTSASGGTSRTGPHAMGPAEANFQQGTNDMLDEARGVVENAVGQGQEIDAGVYQQLGMQPIMEDRTADLAQASQDVSTAQAQFDQLSKNIDAINGIPLKKRTPGQKKQLKQLNKQIQPLQGKLADLTKRYGQLQTMPLKITGFNRMDPKDIPASSPFSAQNPLNTAQTAEAQRLNEYLSGQKDVDPTLKHEWAAQESSLRAQLAQRYGPDYENTSVGQMALQNLSRQRDESFTSWNESMVEKYNNLAFGGAANLQQLMLGQIHLAYAPSEEAAKRGQQLAADANARIDQERVLQTERGKKSRWTGTTTTTPPAPVGEAAGVAGQVAGGLGALAKNDAATSGPTTDQLFAPGPEGSQFSQEGPMPLTELAATGQGSV